MAEQTNAPEVDTAESTVTPGVPDNPGEDAGESPLKWSAQVLQRMHEDAERLLADYDEMAGPLENPNVIKHMKTKLESLVTELEDIEDLFAAEHPDLPGIGEGGSKAAPGAAEEAEEDAETNPTEADSEEEEETPPEEVVEGMKTKGMKSKSKSMACSGGKGCTCAKCVKSKSLKGKRKSADPHDVPGYEEAQDKPGKRGSEEDIKGLEEDKPGIPGHEEAQEKPGKPGEETDFTKSLQGYERKHVKEAAAFLHELGHTSEFGDEHRMKSYHFHKALSDIGGLAGGVIGTAVGGPLGGAVGGAIGSTAGGVIDEATSGKKAVPGYEEHQEKPGTEHTADTLPGNPGYEEDAKVGGDFDESNLHPHRKSARGASHFFKALTTERAFGDAHREQAEHWGKALDPIGDAVDEDDVQTPDSNEQDVPEGKDFPAMDEEDREDNVTEPGELGEKAAALYATAAKQQKALLELTKLAKTLAEVVKV